MNIHKKPLIFKEPLEPLEKIELIVIHHTSREDMDVEQAHDYHQNERGWNGIGYNFFIEKTGELIEGRGFYVGAHAYGYNRTTIGVCVTGDFDQDDSYPTENQMDTLKQFLHYLMNWFNLNPYNIVGHRELNGATTTCPGQNFNLELLRIELMK